MTTLVIATKNAGKLAEFRAVLDGTGIELRSLADYPELPDIEENGATFFENARIKARETCAHTGFPALADDSGLVVDALDGDPGVHSARFAPTTEERNAKLLALMENIPDNQRTARFVCTLVLVRPDGFEWTASGTVEGIIAREPSGAAGFGYDPLFFCPQPGMTFAEIPMEEKNRISHRGRALAAFGKAVAEEGIL